MKIGGEFGGISKIKARILFLLQIESLKPEVIEEIETMLPIYGELNYNYLNGAYYEEQDDKQTKDKKMLEYHVQAHWKALLHSPELHPLLEALQRWGDKYNIAEKWVYEAALGVLRMAYILDRENSKYLNDPIIDEFVILRNNAFKSWHLEISGSEEEFSEYHMGMVENASLGDEDQVLVTSYPTSIIEKLPSLIMSYTWNPFRIDKASFYNHVRNAFESELNDYIKLVESLIPEDQIRNVKSRNMERFEWLVRYQVCGESYNKIAKSVYTSREAVTARVKETADWCGIRLRPPGKPGRPKKK